MAPQPNPLDKQQKPLDAAADQPNPLRPEEAEQRVQERKTDELEGQKVVSTKDRLSLSASLTGARIDNLKETLESMGTVYKEFYDLGQSKKENENVRTMRGLEPAVLVGSVDSSRFDVEWHEAKWYKPYIESSAQIFKLFEHKLFDETTQKWLEDLRPALELFVQLGKFGAKDYARKHKNEIWKLVKSKGTGILYSEKGLFNFVLAFDRLKNVCPKLNDVAKDDFKWEGFSVEAIKLVLGQGKGKIKGKNDRYAYMVVKKPEEKKIEDKKPEEDQKKLDDKLVDKPVAPAKTPAPLTPGGPQDVVPNPTDKGAMPDKGKVPVEPPKVLDKSTEVVAGKIPEFKTPEFYKYYEISDQKEFEDVLKPLDEWLTKEKQDFLNDPKFWEKMGVLGSPERNSKIRMYFDDGDKSGAITGVLFPALYNLANDYPKFYGDLKNPNSLKYQELFAITMQRSFEYYKNINLNKFAIKSVVFLTMSEQADNEDLSKDYRKNVLTKLISYCELMSRDDIGGRAEWEESLKEYRQKMKEFETK